MLLLVRLVDALDRMNEQQRRISILKKKYSEQEREETSLLSNVGLRL